MLNNIGTQTINTERLLLRKFKLTDSEMMFKNWANDPEVFKFFRRNPHNELSETEEVIKKWVNEYEDGHCYNWAIELKKMSEIIGQISIVDFNEKFSSCEVAYSIGRKFWGKGITTEALKAVINYMIKEVNINRFEARFNTKNIASGKVMEKAGMKYEGTLREVKINRNGDYYDMSVYSILRSDIL